DFDIYVGLSAGAFLAAPIAAGITPGELLESLEGDGEFGHFRFSDVYFPNFAEMLSRPVEFLTDVATFFPEVLGELLIKAPDTLEALRAPLEAWRREPSFANVSRIASVVVAGMRSRRSFPFFLDYLPSGLFDNRGLERLIREAFASRSLPNHFRALHRE